MQQVSGIDPSAVDPRVQAMLQARADAQARRPGCKAQAAGPVRRAAARGRARGRGTCPIRFLPRPIPGEAAGQRLNAAQESTAGRPALSVAEAKRLHQQEQAAADGEMAALMERARALEEDGKPNVAKIYYQRIAKHATGELQQQARTRCMNFRVRGSHSRCRRVRRDRKAGAF